MKRRLFFIVMFGVLAAGVSAYGQKPAGTQSGNLEKPSVASADKTEPAVSREGFSIQEISDELFDRMRSGNTYKEDCIVPREDLRYLLVLHKDKEGNTHQGGNGCTQADCGGCSGDL